MPPRVEYIRTVQLADLMATDVLAVSPDTTIADAARRMVARDAGAARRHARRPASSASSPNAIYARDSGRLPPRDACLRPHEP